MLIAASAAIAVAAVLVNRERRQGPASSRIVRSLFRIARWWWCLANATEQFVNTFQAHRAANPLADDPTAEGASNASDSHQS